MSNNRLPYQPNIFFNSDSGNYYNQNDDDGSEYETESENEQENVYPRYKNKTHILIVNSSDRNWEDNLDQTQYNFKLNFAQVADQKVSKALYENNPTIPATNSQAMSGNSGDENTSGWTSSTGEVYSAYNASQPLGKIVGYESIIEKCIRGANIKKLYKNVVSIELDNVLIPAHNRSITYTSTQQSLNRSPYLLLTIPEIEESMESTNFEASQAFGFLVPYTNNYDTCVNDLKFHEFHPIENFQKIYYPSPINTLPNLTFQLKEPNGQILSCQNDYLDVKYIYRQIDDTDDPRTDFLWIETLKFFNDNEYQIGDQIIFKNYQYYNTSSGNSYSFNEFINRDQGHTIVAIGVSGDQYLKNRIKISRPASYNLTNGYLDEEFWYTSFKSLELNDNTTISNRDDTNYDTGRLLNVNLQVTYVLKVTTKEYNLDFLTDKIENI